MIDELSADRIREIADGALARLDKLKKSSQPIIPRKLRDPAFRFLLVRPGGKAPVEEGWPSYPYDDTRLAQHLASGGNYGVLPGHGDLCILDIDEPVRLGALLNLSKFEDTFTVANAPGGRRHCYFRCSDRPVEGKFILSDPDKRENHLGEIYFSGRFQVVGPGSIHPSGRAYVVVKDLPIKVFTGAEIDQLIEPFKMKIKIPPAVAMKCRVERTRSPTMTDQLSLRVEDYLMPEKPVQRGDEIQGAHPVHGSETGMNLAINTRTGIWYCFRCKSGGDALMAFAVREGIIRCDEARPGALVGKMGEVRDALRSRGLLKDNVTSGRRLLKKMGILP